MARSTPWVETHGYKDFAPNGAKIKKCNTPNMTTLHPLPT